MSLRAKRSKRPGARALELARGSTDSLILRELQRGARNLDELTLALPAISREVLSEHLSRLTREGWINDDAEASQASAAHGAYQETMPQLPVGAGARAFGILADEMTRRTLLRLGRAEGPTHGGARRMLHSQRWSAEHPLHRRKRRCRVRICNLLDRDGRKPLGRSISATSIHADRASQLPGIELAARLRGDARTDILRAETRATRRSARVGPRTALVTDSGLAHL
jgi:hypothetical protein